MSCQITSPFGVFCIIVILLVFLWSIAVFSALFFDNLFYTSWKFDRTNTLDSFCVTIIILAIFLLFAYLIKMLFLYDMEKRLFSIGLKEERSSNKGALDVIRRPESVGGALSSDSALGLGNAAAGR